MRRIRDQRRADQQQEAQRQHLHGGMCSTKFGTGPDATSITSIASTTAAIMIDRCSAMPTAVTTESMREHDIEQRDLDDDGRASWRPCLVRSFSSPSTIAVDFARALGEQEQAARAEDMSLPRKAYAQMVTNGSDSEMIQAMLDSKMMRMTEREA